MLIADRTDDEDHESIVQQPACGAIPQIAEKRFLPAHDRALVTFL